MAEVSENAANLITDITLLNLSSLLFDHGLDPERSFSTATN